MEPNHFVRIVGETDAQIEQRWKDEDQEIFDNIADNVKEIK